MEEDHTVGGWGHRAACIGAACMMTFNKGAMPPKSYSGYNNPTTPIHRPFDMNGKRITPSVDGDTELLV